MRSYDNDNEDGDTEQHWIMKYNHRMITVGEANTVVSLLEELS